MDERGRPEEARREERMRPAGPTKGVARASSERPGASPIRRRGEGIGPTPWTMEWRWAERSGHREQVSERLLIVVDHRTGGVVVLCDRDQ
jgi:hypothetical protein